MPDGRDGPRGDAPWRNLYGRSRGKRLRPAQRRRIETTLREISVPAVSRAENPDRRPIDLRALFGDRREFALEIGFGGGEHLLAAAAAQPEVGFVGCEPYVNGVAQFLGSFDGAGLSNIRVHPGDARDLLDVLPEGTLSRIFLLYPDPWPKARHHKRRFISPENLDALARAARRGAELRVASDIGDYIRHSLAAALDHPDWDWTAERPADWRRPWPNWPGTRYEAKAVREGRTPTYLTFRRS